MWGVEPPPEVDDDRCTNCGRVISWRYESEDRGIWVHKDSRSIRCELFAEPA